MARLVRVLCIVAYFLAAKACVPPDCDNVDCGTCGNACCILNVTIPLPPAKVYEAMVASFKEGGADKRYTFVGSYDMTSDKIAAKYTMESIHMTKVEHYNDTQYFVIYENSMETSTVRAFSISQIYGAYCDYGQNYKNIVGYVKGLGVKYQLAPVMGCPPKKD
ncbi:uncharacterized protein [Oscarella lobularis]|uniref:uncharacterized protein n=1 Tax=Oscarella lobularis TaxID=121494 RepID=UPI003313F190